MKNRNAFRRLISILLILLTVVSLSCSFNKDEGNGSGTMSNTVIIGKVGKPFTTQTITVQLENASFKALNGTQNVIKNLPDGLATSVIANDKTTTATITISANNTASQNYLISTPSTDNIIFEIPADYLYNQLTPIRIEGPARFNIVDESGRYGYFCNANATNGTIDGTPTELSVSYDGSGADYVINVEGDGVYFAHDFDAGDDITDWFSPSIEGFSVKVKNSIAAKATSMVVTAVQLPYNTITGSQKMSIVIPQGHVTGGELVVDARNFSVKNNGAGYKLEAVVDSNKIIQGEVGTAIEPFDIAIRSGSLINAQNNLDAGADVSSWFAPCVDGLSYTLKDALSTTVNTYYVTVTVSGIPNEKKFADASLTIPVGVLKQSVGSLRVPYDIDLKGMKYEISPKDGYVAYEVYDLATYGDVERSMISLNYSLTKKADGSELGLSADNGYVIASGEGETATIVGGLSRRGYKLAGFNRIGSDGKVSTDVSKLDYTVDKEVKVDATTGDITIAIKDSDKGEKVKLYAIWEVDADAWGWTKNADGTYQKTQDISNGGEYLPATFDLDKAYPGDENAELRKHFISYPYYKEAKVLASDLSFNTLNLNDYYDASDFAPSYDFAIGEHPVTGYMLDVLRAWNTSGSKGYEIPDEESTNTFTHTEPSSDNNKVGYGALGILDGGSTYTYYPINEKSQPITFVTVTQGMIIANAMTAYYNEKAKDSEGFKELTFAYIVKDSTDEIKTLKDAKALYDATTTNKASMATKGATGFRLPTSDEWDVAARLVPENSYPTSLTGYHSGLGTASSANIMYPQTTRSDMFSGADFNFTDQNLVVYPGEVKYSWYRGNAGTYIGTTRIDSTTHGFLAKSIENRQVQGREIYPGTVLDKMPNNLGVYGMSGNVWEWCDSVYSSGSSRRLRGGSFGTNASYTRVGTLGSNSASARYGNFGLRLARGL